MQKNIYKAIFPLIDVAAKTDDIHLSTLLPLNEAIMTGFKQLIVIIDERHKAIEAKFHDLCKQLPADILPVLLFEPQLTSVGAALLAAKKYIAQEPFAVFLSNPALTKAPILFDFFPDMLKQYQVLGGNFIAVKNVSNNLMPLCDIVSVNENSSKPKLIETIVERPEPILTTSNLAVVGRFIFQPEMILLLEQLKLTTPELKLSDAIAELLHVQNCYAYEIH